MRIDNGLPSALYPGTSCFNRRGSPPPTPYTSAATYTVGYKVVDSKSVNLGMPTTLTTPDLHNEYYVEANQLAVVSVTYNTSFRDIPGVANSVTDCDS